MVEKKVFFNFFLKVIKVEEEFLFIIKKDFYKVLDLWSWFIVGSGNGDLEYKEVKVIKNVDGLIV